MADLDYQYLAALVIHAQNGDSNAFAELYAATYQKQYRFACRYLRDEYLAQDAIQEAYTLALKNISTLRDPQVFVSWLNQITLRICVNMQRYQQQYSANHVQLDDMQIHPEAHPSESPETMTISIDEKEYLMRQVLSLPFTESQVIVLRYYKDMKIDDIARLMNISRSSVKRYLKSGQEKLSQKLTF